MNTLTIILRAVAVLGLILILVVSILYAGESISHDRFKLGLVVGSLIWFAAILLSNRKKMLNYKLKK